MADITISDLELAPALADDMVLAVENTTDTYAATLAMLRRLINKTFVEVEDANFNDLTDDGFYQCTGTPTNSPEAGEINWTLQVSAESGVVVQRAFSLDDNFANLYIRRWNGVSWTAWIEEGGGALTHKANVDLDNLSTTGLNVLNKIVPTGSIIIFGGETAPEGYLICNGGAISRTTYADLFGVIGTLYGSGDGSTTFNIPNFNYKSVWQDPNYLGISFAGFIPNITGRAYTNNNQGIFLNSDFSGSFYGDSLGGTFSAGTISSDFAKGFNFDASRSSSVYTNGQTQVVPAAVCIHFLIKY